MQASAFCIAPSILPLTPSKTHLVSSPAKLGGSLDPHRFSIKAATATNETATVDYSSIASVFPAEACETIGGEACLADMYPEVKLKPEARRNSGRTVAEPVDREYLEYNDAKTVLRGEACDVLGGEFCGREYQRGVY